MTVIRSGMILSMIAASLAIGACATEESAVPARPAGGAPSQTTVSQGPANPLQECLAKIPKDATPGQRSFAEMTCQRDHGTGPTDTRRESKQYDPGPQGDTLQACMNRIPGDATPGQRMIAEQSCKRDEASR